MSDYVECPECGRTQGYERATKDPRYRCLHCGETFATPAGQCCVAGVETLPSGRPYCGGCGRVLEGTDDPRTEEATA